MKWGFLGASAALCLSLPVHASLSVCARPEGCTFPISAHPADNLFFFDYTVPPDGQAYLWSLRLSDPAATVFLSLPNQVEAFTRVKTADGYTAGYLSRAGFPWTFVEDVQPGLTTIRVQAPRSFDGCDSAQVGELCGASYNVWGNGSVLTFTAAPSNVTMWFTQSAVPEPASWASLLTGFALLGAAARRRVRWSTERVC